MKNKQILIVLSIIVLIGVLFLLYQKNPNQNNNILNDEDIINKIESNKDYSCYYSRENYPKTLGIHSKNNLTLIEVCGCSDYCPPELWYVSIYYQNISSEEECVEIGGRIRIDAAWGVYRGCAPDVE